MRLDEYSVFINEKLLKEGFLVAECHFGRREKSLLQTMIRT